MISASSLSGAAWRKSSYSGSNGGNCLEIADNILGAVPVRDSKDVHGPALSFHTRSWGDFVSALNNGTLSA